MTESIRFDRSTARHEYADRVARADEQAYQVISMPAFEFAVQFDNAENAHVVELVRDGDAYEASCTCKDFEYRSTVCKHMWAVFSSPHAAVLDARGALGLSVDPTDAMQVGGQQAVPDGGVTARTSSTLDPRRGGQPNTGTRVETWMVERFPIEFVDAKMHDARLLKDTELADEGAPVQIAATREQVRNGYDSNNNQKYTEGRIAIYDEELLHMLEAGGVYLVGTYHPNRSAFSDDYVTRLRWLTPEQIGAAVGEWTPSNKPKGMKARVKWSDLL